MDVCGQRRRAGAAHLRGEVQRRHGHADGGAALALLAVEHKVGPLAGSGERGVDGDDVVVARHLAVRDRHSPARQGGFAAVGIVRAAGGAKAGQCMRARKGAHR